MAESMHHCPVCGEEFSGERTDCPRCGFKCVGATEKFSAVQTPVVVTDVTYDKSPALEVVKGPYAGERFVLKKGRFVIGRDPSCDLFLNNMTVSRQHAVIIIDDAGARIEDVNSLNGTWVDGVVVDAAPLVKGSVIQIGTFEMVFCYIVE